METSAIAIVNVALLNVRTTAEKDGTVMEVISEGTQLPVLSMSDEWVCVRIGKADGIGFVVRDYVTIKE